MMFKLIVLSLFTLLLIFLDYKKRNDLKKSIIAISLFGYILVAGYSSFITLRVIAPLFFIHILGLIASYFALIWYLFNNKLYYQIFLIPIFTIALFFIINFFDGSRYES